MRGNDVDDALIFFVITIVAIMIRTMTLLTFILGPLILLGSCNVDASGVGGWNFTVAKNKQQAIALATSSEQFCAFNPRVMVQSDSSRLTSASSNVIIVSPVAYRD